MMQVQPTISALTSAPQAVSTNQTASPRGESLTSGPRTGGPLERPAAALTDLAPAKPASLSDLQIERIVSDLKSLAIASRRETDSGAGDESLTGRGSTLASPGPTISNGSEALTDLAPDAITQHPKAGSSQRAERLSDIAPPSREDGVLADRGESLRPRLESLAQKIAERLDEAGFTHQPPANLRSLLDQLGLRPGSSARVLDLLSARFPDGLGLSMIG